MNWGRTGLALWACWMGTAAMGAEAPLHICVDERAHPPYLKEDGSGTAQILLQMAAAKLGQRVEFHYAPQVRCVEELRRNQSQGYPTAGYSVTLQPVCAYPMRDGRPDPTRATATVRVMAYRRVGGAADWDGQRMRDAGAPVLVARGSPLMMDRLRALGVRVDDGGQDTAVNFAKLLAGRGELVIAPGNDGQQLLALATFAGKIEQLPAPFFVERLHLCLSRQFRDADPARAEALWTAVGQVARSAEYRAATSGLD